MGELFDLARAQCAVHGLVNNAGAGMQHIGNVLVGARKKFYEVDADTWRNAIDVNFKRAVHDGQGHCPDIGGARLGADRQYRDQQLHHDDGRVLALRSVKAALEAATVIWAKDLAGTGVTVNALAPGGPANTRMIPATEVTDRSTLIQPEVMIAAVVWLMSPRSDGVTGRPSSPRNGTRRGWRASPRRRSERRRDGEERKRWIRATCMTRD